MRFNDPSPNWLTTARLSKTLSVHEEKLCALGAVPVILHADCGRDARYEKAVANYGSSGYWRYVLPDGLIDVDLARDGIIYFDGAPMTTDRNEAVAHQRATTRPCPCGGLSKKHPHTMTQYFIWPETAETILGELCDFPIPCAMRFWRQTLRQPPL